MGCFFTWMRCRKCTNFVVFPRGPREAPEGTVVRDKLLMSEAVDLVKEKHFFPTESVTAAKAESSQCSSNATLTQGLGTFKRPLLMKSLCKSAFWA